MCWLSEANGSRVLKMGLKDAVLRIEPVYHHQGYQKKHWCELTLAESREGYCTACHSVLHHQGFVIKLDTLFTHDRRYSKPYKHESHPYSTWSMCQTRAVELLVELLRKEPWLS